MTVTLATILAAAFLSASPGGEIFDGADVEFLRKIDPAPLSILGVQYNGRVAVLDTVAREQLSQMTGRRRIEGIPPAVAYLELYFNAGRYLSRPLIHVRQEKMRLFVAPHLTGRAGAAFQRTNRIPPACLLNNFAIRELVETTRADMQQYARAGDIPSLGGALASLSQQRQYKLLVDRLYARYSAFLALDMLRLIPVVGGDWPAAEELLRAGAPHDHKPALPAGAQELGRKLIALRDAWRARDHRRVNSIAAELCRLLPAASADYPAVSTRRLEMLYNRTYKGTLVWIGFGVSLVLLIIAAASQQTWARRVGLAVFALSTLLLAGGLGIRWAISGRVWYLPPMMNQWEAVTSSALLGAVLVIVLELIWKKNYLALAGALYATAALLCGHFIPAFFPGQMDSHLTALHGLLASKIMAVHVSVIIIGHALVGMTFFISVLYLLVRAWRGSLVRPASAAADLAGTEAVSSLAAIDRCNLIVAQLACWTVLLGTILGAYWADIAWARWWGWDRKETWALLTVIVYIVALHLRFVTPARSRGLVTAVICILGCAVMMFNWIVVNFFLAGMHSYA